MNGSYARTGTLGVVEQVGRLPTASRRGGPRHRARAHRRRHDRPRAPRCGSRATPLAEVVGDATAARWPSEYKALATSILQQRGAWQVVDPVQSIDDPSALADLAGYAPYLTTEQKIELLETPDVAERLTKLIAWSRRAPRRAGRRRDHPQGRPGGRGEAAAGVPAAPAARRRPQGARRAQRQARERGGRLPRPVEAADLPEKVREAALKEVDKLERTPTQSPEVGWIRTWLDTVLELPWNERTEDAYDIAGARAVLDADHAGLEDVKERIIEYLAVRKRRAERGLGVVGGRRSGAVLALVGPPGVGKTSLGESVARAMGRKFVRVALGGVRDEAEIRGHRRTYVGALPGRIVRAIKEAGSMNPVVLLDEIDKVGSDYRGDPTAALLEVLDPAQNHTFRDHYLEVELDLSDVVFLATANVLESIPARCWTGWSWSGSTATPRTRRSSSPGTTCCRVSWSGPG